MVTNNYPPKSSETSTVIASIFRAIRLFLKEKTEGLNLFQQTLLLLYILMTLFFFAAAFYFVFTKGFKY